MIWLRAKQILKFGDKDMRNRKETTKKISHKYSDITQIGSISASITFKNAVENIMCKSHFYNYYYKKRFCTKDINKKFLATSYFFKFVRKIIKKHKTIIKQISTVSKKMIFIKFLISLFLTRKFLKNWIVTK